MSPEVYVALNHLKDFVKREAAIMHPKLDKSLSVIEEALKAER